jgi:hypothetical protein
MHDREEVFKGEGREGEMSDDEEDEVVHIQGDLAVRLCQTRKMKKML